MILEINKPLFKSKWKRRLVDWFKTISCRILTTFFGIARDNFNVSREVANHCTIGFCLITIWSRIIDFEWEVESDCAGWMIVCNQNLAQFQTCSLQRPKTKQSNPHAHKTFKKKRRTNTNSFCVCFGESEVHQSSYEISVSFRLINHCTIVQIQWSPTKTVTKFLEVDFITLTKQTNK